MWSRATWSLHRRDTGLWRYVYSPPLPASVAEVKRVFGASFLGTDTPTMVFTLPELKTDVTYAYLLCR
jgi:hypothetical protein